MRDISEQFYELVLHHRSAGPHPGLSHSPARPGPGSHVASFAVTANHIAEEILRVNEAVRRDNQHFLRHMCCGVEVDDQPLQETEQLLSGAAHHVLRNETESTRVSLDFRIIPNAAFKAHAAGDHIGHHRAVYAGPDPPEPGRPGAKRKRAEGSAEDSLTAADLGEGEGDEDDEEEEDEAGRPPAEKQRKLNEASQLLKANLALRTQQARAHQQRKAQAAAKPPPPRPTAGKGHGPGKGSGMRAGPSKPPPVAKSRLKKQRELRKTGKKPRRAAGPGKVPKSGGGPS
eukprot:EG_transcript_15002